MNLGDDLPLLKQMKQAAFRFVFMGIETPDPDLLLKTQKSQNTVHPIKTRVHNIVEHGIIVTAGFIIGFDGEKKGTDRSLIHCIDETAICMAMMGLLVALPNTQLTRRLLKEKRLLDFSLQPVDESGIRAKVDDLAVKAVDQTLAGLNFETTRDRFEIMEEFLRVVKTVYAPKAYMSRALRTAEMMDYRLPRLVQPFELRRSLRAMFVLSWRMTKIKELRFLYWKNFFLALRLGLYRFEIAMTLMGAYLHFRSHSQHLEELMPQHVAYQRGLAQSKKVDPKAS